MRLNLRVFCLLDVHEAFFVFIMCDIQQLVDVTEEISTQFLHIAEAEADAQGTQTAVAALQDLRYTSETSKWSMKFILPGPSHE